MITVAIVAYNNALYVRETLESIYNQTYSAIEIVISDDCSTDKTLDVVRNWVAQERVKKRFQSIKVISVPKNTGVSANCNRCIEAASGDWIKFTAGDDILLPDTIKDNMQFVADFPEARIVFSQVKVYQDTFEEKNFVRTTPIDFPNNLMNAKFSAADQNRILLVEDRIHYTPSYFFNKQALLGVGGYDEQNRLAEDYPMWLKLTASGERLFYFHKPTAGYRMHSKAANNVSQELLFKPSVLYAFKIRKRIAHPYLPWEMVALEYQVYYISILFQQCGWNKNRSVYKKLYHLSCFYLNPFYYLYAIKKRMTQAKDNLFYQ
jgi:glycosyltransferase involved in cell wall biosynthesis